MLLELILILQLKIIFTEKPQIDCGVANAGACIIYQTNTIYLGYRDNINYNLYHEIGHAIFRYDNFGYKNIIKDYEGFDETYLVINGNSDDKILGERVADYFAEYMTRNKEFSVKYPCLYIYFRDIVDEIITKGR